MKLLDGNGDDNDDNTKPDFKIVYKIVVCKR